MATASSPTGRRHVVARAADLPDGSVEIVEVAGRSIGVYNVDGRLYGLRNVCPHHGAPLCRGPVSGTMLPSDPQEYRYSETEEHLIVRCPWHGYEFRLDDGRSLVAPDRMRAKTYRVEREGDEIVLYL